MAGLLLERKIKDENLIIFFIAPYEKKVLAGNSVPKYSSTKILRDKNILGIHILVIRSLPNVYTGKKQRYLSINYFSDFQYL